MASSGGRGPEYDGLEILGAVGWSGSSPPDFLGAGLFSSLSVSDPEKFLFFFHFARFCYESGLNFKTKLVVKIKMACYHIPLDHLNIFVKY